MSYYDIFIIGWNLNAIMFVSNLLMAISTFNSQDIINIQKQSEILKELKERYEELYPYKRYEILISYFIPFTAFYRISYRYYEMHKFFQANSGTKMYDYMIYSYTKDINNKGQ
jgi:hypothetical protein